MIEYRVTDSIGAFTRDQWDALFNGHLERFDYLLAVESAGMGGFRWRYVVAEDGGELIAAVPAFLTDYALDTTLSGWTKRFAKSLRGLFPRALVLRMACLGSPCTESLPVGIAPSVDPERHADLLGGILRAFERDARNSQCSLLAVKDLASANEPLWRQVAWSAGYRPAAGLPSAALAVDFASMDEYLARLSPGTRRDMRRKLRSRDAVRLERRGNIDDVIDAVMRLYGDTRERAQLKFEELTPAYFQGVLARVPGAFCVLYFAGHELLAMNLLIEGDGLLLDKFFCMDGNAGRDYNLYFLSWFSNIEYCLSAGLDRYFSGQAGYATKLRLGSTLSGTSMYFRHGNALVNGVLRASASLFTRSLGVAS